MGRPLLLLLGDSITQFGSNWKLGGWICLLLDRYNRSADIAQRGMAGYTTQNFMNSVVATLSADLSTSLHPQLITLWLGANDAALSDGPSSGQHVPLPTYKANLHSMVALFKATAPQGKVLLITPPAVDDNRRKDKDGHHDRTNAATGEYARACCAVAKEAGVEVLDLYSLFNAKPEAEWKALLVDGLHLSSQGNHVMEEYLVETIRAKFPELQKQLDTKEFPFVATEPTSETPMSWWTYFFG